MKRMAAKQAFIKSIPIMCSYLFVSMAYGIMMEEAGFRWYYSLLISLTVYTGAFQFVLITFLSSGASLITIALTAFLMNSRQTFYSLTFVEAFRGMGKKLPYMIHTMTDETYAVNCSLQQEGRNQKDIMFWVAFFSRCYWMTGAVIGGVLGQLIPFDLEGIDFCMTALFIIIFIDQWEKSKNHLPAIVGLAVAIICLMIFGQSNFMLAALVAVSGILLLLREKEEEA
jgi:4-azaleucine resistance transporter AzlC